MKSRFIQGKRLILSIIGLALVCSAFFFFAKNYEIKPKPASGLDKNFPEISELSLGTKSFDELQKYFKDLAEKKGARYAYDVLRVVPLAPNIDLHLLGHTVGDVLYKQEGANGITACNNDFRNACSHSIVVGLFYAKGEEALGPISEACRKAPGGRGAYTMCFHGLGHGILSYAGYDMAKGAEICKKTGTKEFGNSEIPQCIGGMIMEIISGGFHDKEVWAGERVKYLKKDDPLSLCRSSFIPDASRFMCYEYITPYLFEAVGADMGSPTGKDFEQAFKFCNAVPKSEGENRDACFGGFGKEFDGVVQARDIRQESINNMKADQIKQVYDWCLLAKEKDGTAACIVHALNSLYWGGENDRDVSIRFCNAVETDYFKNSCFIALMGNVSYYGSDAEYKKSFCGEIPVQYQPECRNRLKVN